MRKQCDEIREMGNLLRTGYSVRSTFYGERVMGIEPMTFCLEGKRSTSELHSHVTVAAVVSG